MKCSRFCIEQPRPTRLILLGPPWSREIPYMPSGEPYSPPHHCSRLERPRSPGDEIKIVHPVTWRTPSHHHALAVQAAPRPLHDSLRATLASLEAAGLRRWPGPKFVMADGCQPDVPSPWQVFATMDGPPGLGSARTFLAAFRKALEIDPGLELLTIFEDDVALSRNALDYIQVVEMPADVAMISWYSWEWKPPGPLLPPLPRDPAIAILLRQPGPDPLPAGHRRRSLLPDGGQLEIPEQERHHDGLGTHGRPPCRALSQPRPAHGRHELGVRELGDQCIDHVPGNRLQRPGSSDLILPCHTSTPTSPNQLLAPLRLTWPQFIET